MYNTLKKAGNPVEAKEAKTAYNEAKRLVKDITWLANSEAERGAFATVSPNDDGVFRIAKKINDTNQVLFGENCVH